MLRTTRCVHARTQARSHHTEHITWTNTQTYLFYTHTHQVWDVVYIKKEYLKHVALKQAVEDTIPETINLGSFSVNPPSPLAISTGARIGTHAHTQHTILHA